MVAGVSDQRGGWGSGAHMNGEYVGVFIPTTSSPVNGFYFYVRKAGAPLN